MANILQGLGQSQAISGYLQGINSLRQQALQEKQGEQALQLNDINLAKSKLDLAEAQKKEEFMNQTSDPNMSPAFSWMKPDQKQEWVGKLVNAGFAKKVGDNIYSWTNRDQQNAMQMFASNTEMVKQFSTQRLSNAQNEVLGLSQQVRQLQESGKGKPEDIQKLTQQYNAKMQEYNILLGNAPKAIEMAQFNEALQSFHNDNPDQFKTLTSDPNFNMMISLAQKGNEKARDAVYKMLENAAKPQIKEINLPPNIDAFLTQKFGSKYTSSSIVDRKQYIDYLSTPQGKKEFEEFAPKYAAMTATPFYNVIPTSEGLTRFNARQPNETPINTGLGKPLSPEMITSEQQFKTLKEGLDVVKKLYKSDYVGPGAGRYGTIKENIIGLPKDQATFYSALEGMKNQLIYALSGKQINENEYNRLLAQLPTRNLPKSTFQARMNEFDRTLDSIIKNRHDAMGGYGIPNTNIKNMSDAELKKSLGIP